MLDKTLEPIAIFAGRGILPKMLIENCEKNNRKFLLFLLDGEKYEIDYSAFNPITVPYGAIEKFLKILRENQIKNLVFIGGVTKPNFSSLKVDKKGAILLAKILASKILGDDAVLRAVIKFFEKEGLKILKIEDLLNCVISTKSTLTNLKPSEENFADIKIGINAVKHFSSFDVGQSVVVAQKQIIAVEALEGTDEMIKRCKNLPVNYKENAVLVKLKKRNQSGKADLPTIGLETVKNCYESGIKGIVIQVNSTLVLQREEMVSLANELKMFIIVV